ncbi:DUF1127 domain-containing protein [Nisaea nitritireducens]|uniref:DUF1127 domain-containing protein n=1 Tax=Nisaea nitritireducens TaxID=568392 RepID=UPI0018669B4D|nr:DUF1127 domain-containing protein [Nisaea nitritireducens]
MHLRHHQTDLAYDFKRPHPKHPFLNTLSRLTRAMETAVRQGLGKISRERQRRDGVRELHSLSDRQLLDIGVERSQIAETVEKVLEQKAPK